MYEVSYEYKLERKLINEFRDKFFETLGYYPIVYGRNNISGYRAKVLTLDELKIAFKDYLPTSYGKAIPLDSKSRRRELVEIRMIYCFIARSMKYGLKSIGESLRRDHTTVLHSLDTFANLMGTNELFRERFDMISGDIKKLLNVEDESSDMGESDKISDESEPVILSRLLQIQNQTVLNSEYRRGIQDSKKKWIY